MVPLPVSGPQTYTYEIPGDSPPLFTRVTIPFGRRNVQGVVTGFHERRVSFPTKPLLPSSPWQLTAYQLKFATWIARTMQGGLGFTLRLFFPATAAPRAQADTIVPKRRSARVSRQVQQQLEQLTHPQALIDADRERRWTKIAELTRAVVARGEQVLILVPEKQLLEEMHLFISTAALVDGDLTARQYSDVWHDVHRGACAVVIGTQKAVYLPYQRLGLIVLEEEAFDTHKLWDAYPRLDNHYAVRQLSEIYGSRLLYAGSFPSVDLTWRRERGDVQSLQWEPVQPLVDLMSVPVTEWRMMLSPTFLSQLARWVGRGERVLLLHNRRGTWSVTLCRDCQRTVSCPACGTALVLHRAARGMRLQCHHCGHEQAQPSVCPHCGTGKLRVFGAGSGRVAELVQQAVPGRPIGLLDADTEDVSSVLERVARGGILIGTTAVFRQLTAGSVDRAVYLWPEQTMLYPDFRSEERAQQMLWRLHRLAPATRPVHIVSRLPRLLRERLLAPTATLLPQQLRERQQLQLPPWTDLVQLTFQGATDEAARRKAALVRERLDARATEGVTLRGPYQGFVRGWRGVREAHVLMSGELSRLTDIYDQQPIDTVDVAPAHVL